MAPQSSLTAEGYKYAKIRKQPCGILSCRETVKKKEGSYSAEKKIKEEWLYIFLRMCGGAL